MPDYVMPRKDTSILWFRFQWPKDVFPNATSRKRECSLGTSDLAEAKLLAAKMAAECKQMVRHHRILAKAKITNSVADVYKQNPDEVVTHADGTTSIVWRDEIVYLGSNGVPTGRYEHNTIKGSPRNIQFANYEDAADYRDLHKANRAAVTEMLPYLRSGAVKLKAPTKPTPDEEDLDILTFYFDKKAFTKAQRSPFMSAYRDFKAFLPNRSLRTVTHKEACKFFDHVYPEGTAHNTAKKKVNSLSQAMRIAIKFGDFDLTINPFEGAVSPERRIDAQRRRKAKPVPLSEADMKIMRDHLPRMPQKLQLMWVLMATTGMRNSEALGIHYEMDPEDGHRRIEIGEKSESSFRTIPIPDAVLALPFFPAKIEGPLFEGAMINDKDKFRVFCTHMSNEMNAVMKALGLKEGVKTKTAYSLRHRAITRLDSAKVGKTIGEAIVGHADELTVHDGYIGVPPTSLLHEKMLAIGY